MLKSSKLPVITLAICALISAIATYGVLTSFEKIYIQSPWVMTVLMVVNLTLFVSLLVLVGRKFWKMWQLLKPGAGSSSLQKRIVRMFALGAIVPGVLVSLLAGYLFYFGIQSWFDHKVATALDESVAVAEAYMNEHLQVLRADLLAMSNDINQQSVMLLQKPEFFQNFVSGQALIRSLTEAVVFQQGRVLAQSQLSFSFAFERLPAEIQKTLDNGEVAILEDRDGDRVRALVKLAEPMNAYLMVGRLIDPRVLGHLSRTQGAVSEYQILQQRIHGLQLNFFSIFMLVSMLLLLAALWRGLALADDIMQPISELYDAAENVRNGDMTVQVRESSRDDELAILGRAFNRMIRQIDAQQKELVAAQRYAAWSDVARRIAHEIKNPLTPIQLATERLKRKYGKNLEGEDKENFNKYIDMLDRHTTDIRNMVDEFASFARMPAPQLQQADLCELIRAVVFSEECRKGAAEIKLYLPDSPVVLGIDPSQMGRALANILKNAHEAMENNVANAEINVTMRKCADSWEIVIEDNGPGFPADIMPRLTEPYVTTRQKGTGLGMAIVRKIVEDHKGKLQLENRAEGGARVIIRLPA